MKPEIINSYEDVLREVIREIYTGHWVDRLHGQLFIVKEGYRSEEGRLIAPETFILGEATYVTQQTKRGDWEITITIQNQDTGVDEQYARITYEYDYFVIRYDSSTTTYNDLLNDRSGMGELLLAGL